jgi:4-hydroxy-tetrahydrodipicolinate reductase
LKAAVAPEDVMIVMNGLPGAMGLEVAAACRRRGFQLAPVALTGASFGGTSVEVVAEPTDPASTEYGPPVTVALVDGTDAAATEGAAADIKAAAAAAGCGGNVVCIDYTHPDAVNGNAEWYAAHGFAFVMGTTGGDRELLEATVANAGTHCVIAPNMAKQIVALQATLEGMAAKFPGAFEGYKLTVRESHQSTKADTSGTAKVSTAGVRSRKEQQCK